MTGLHEYPLDEDQWWACDHPERRHINGITAYDERCHRCLIAMRAACEVGDCGPMVLSGSMPGRGPLHQMTVEDWLVHCWPRFYSEALARAGDA